MNHSYSFYTLFAFLLLLHFGTAQAADFLDEAKHAFQQGHYDKAFSQWQAALDTTENPNHRLEALLGIARIHRRLGVYNQAQSLLQTALSVAEQSGNTHYHALLLNELSKLSLSQRNNPAAIEAGKRAVSLAHSLNNPLVLIEVLNHWGNLLTAEYDYDGALETFSEALTHADNYQKQLSIWSHQANKSEESKSQIETLRGKILINQAKTTFLNDTELAQFQFGQSAFKTTMTVLQSALHSSTQQDWTDSYKQVFGLITVSQLAQKIQTQLTEPSMPLTQITYQALIKARQLANRLNNATAKAYSYGYLGQLYEQQQRYREALYLTRQALFFAGQTRQQFWLNYLWQWQLGRILKAQHHFKKALSAYQQAMDNFQQVRTLKVTTGYVNLMEIDFRQETAPIYFELADLLLQQARVASTASYRDKLLRQARATIERFREAELQNYLQTECLNFNTQCFDSETSLDTQTALLYPIPLPNRLELLLQRREGLIQVTVPITEKTLRQTINAFFLSLHNHPNPEELANTRNQRISAGQEPSAETCTPALRGKQPEKTTTAHFLEPAQTLYDWLIEPLIPHLQNIKTLVIVPDGALRSVPFAAFHDGEQFLIETLALATLPNLCFNTLSVLPSQPKSQTILLSGLSKAVQGFSALPCTEYELEILQTLYDEAPQPLLNETFTLRRLQTHLNNKNYTTLHIASHGQFSAHLENTFVLTYDDKLNLDKLKRLISLTQLKTKQSVELLTLSACETAVGDERAALGLAGVALKAGAQSVLASLWRVDDEATPAVIIEFYRQLQTSAVSKAQALQHAQNLVLNDDAYQHYRHPYYWAAFLLIGNWF